MATIKFYKKIQYIGYWSQTRDGNFPTKKTTANITWHSSVSICTLLTNVTRVTKKHCFLEGSPVTETWKWLWNIDGIIVTGEHRRPRHKTCPSVILSTKNPTWTALTSNPEFRVEGPASNSLTHGTAFSNM